MNFTLKCHDSQACASDRYPHHLLIMKFLKHLLTETHSSTDNAIKSKIPRFNLFHFEKILNDINENRHHVDEVIQRLNQGNSAEEQLRTLNRLYQSKYEQYENMKEKIKEEGLDLDEVIFQRKQFKVGQGIPTPDPPAL